MTEPPLSPSDSTSSAQSPAALPAGAGAETPRAVDSAAGRESEVEGPGEEPSAAEAEPRSGGSERDGAGAIARSSGAGGSDRPSYLLLAVVSLVTLATDLVTKAWAERRLDNPEAFFHPIEVIPGHLDFVLARNKGGAFGFLQETPEFIRKPLFPLISAAAVIFIVSLYRRLTREQTALKWGLPLVLGGALGNVVDRIRYSWVIDFIHAHAQWGGRDHHWPTFNVADIAICVGVGLMAVDMFGEKARARRRSLPAPPPGAAASEPPDP